MQLQANHKSDITAPVRRLSDQYSSQKAHGPLLDRVYSLRYKSYSNGNYIEEDRSEKFIDSYDKMSNCTSFLVYRDKKAIASIRVCVYNPAETALQVPSQEVFSDEIKKHIGVNQKFAEINKFVVDPSFQSKGGLRARFELFKAMAEESVYCDIENVVMAVRTDHVRFYERLFECVQISEEKDYPGLKFKTVLLLMKNINRARNLVFSKTSIDSEKNESVFRCSNY